MKSPTICRARREARGPRGILFLFCVCTMFAVRSLQGAASAPTASSIFADAFVAPSVARNGASRSTWESPLPNHGSALSVFGGDNNDESDNKFDMAQRIESLKSVVLGALSGGIALTPIAYLHYVVFSDVSSTAQWEFTTDMSSLEAALFAIVYRYAVRANDNNPMLNQGVVGAFVVVRTLSNIQVTDTCQSVPLRCKLAF